MVNLLHHRTTPRWVSAERGQVRAIELTRPQPQVLVVDIDLARSEQVRRIWPFLRDRRIDAYDDLLKRYRD